MSYFEAMIIVLFGIILPTADVATDCLLAITLFVGREVWKKTRQTTYSYSTTLTQGAEAHGPIER